MTGESGQWALSWQQAGIALLMAVGAGGLLFNGLGAVGAPLVVLAIQLGATAWLRWSQ